MEERADIASSGAPASGAASSGAVLETPLAAAHARAGAKMGVWFECALPDDFGDTAAEYRYARESVALIDKNYCAYLSFTGPDRVRYLNAILTNNIKDLAVGEGNVSLLLNPQGHILAEIETYACADKLFCVSYAMIRQRLIEWLEKYIIMDDVTLTDETERFGMLALEGPRATAAAKELTGIDVASMNELASVDGEIRSAPFDSTQGKPFGAPFVPQGRQGKQDDSVRKNQEETIPCRVVKRSPGGVAGADFIVPREKLAGLWEILVAAVRKYSGGPMGFTALSARRLALGVPWFGYDFGEKQIPHEAGLEHSHISYTKGCYTGQEIVERVRSRGQVNRRRVELLFSGDMVPEAGAALTLDGKEMGYVTRAAKIPAAAVGSPAQVIGMGYVRKEGNPVGTALHWAHGIATVARFAEALRG